MALNVTLATSQVFDQTDTTIVSTIKKQFNKLKYPNKQCNNTCNANTGLKNLFLLALGSITITSNYTSPSKHQSGDQ